MGRCADRALSPTAQLCHRTPTGEERRYTESNRIVKKRAALWKNISVVPSITLSRPELSAAQTGEWTRDNRLNNGRYRRVDCVKINQINGTIVNQSLKKSNICLSTSLYPRFTRWPTVFFSFKSHFPRCLFSSHCPTIRWKRSRLTRTFKKKTLKDDRAQFLQKKNIFSIFITNKKYYSLFKINILFTPVKRNKFNNPWNRNTSN